LNADRLVTGMSVSCILPDLPYTGRACNPC
jgi:hypothetical protein